MAAPKRAPSLGRVGSCWAGPLASVTEVFEAGTATWIRVLISASAVQSRTTSAKTSTHCCLQATGTPSIGVIVASIASARAATDARKVRQHGGCELGVQSAQRLGVMSDEIMLVYSHLYPDDLRAAAAVLDAAHENENWVRMWCRCGAGDAS